MKFTCSVTVNLPLEKTVALFANEENLYKWQDGLVSIKHIKGVPGEVGSESIMHYKSNRYQFDLKETILENDLPHVMKGLYQHDHMENTMTNRFEEMDESRTRWTAELEYIKFKKLLPKLMFKLMPGMFKRQTQKWLDNFKSFAESQ